MRADRICIAVGFAAPVVASPAITASSTMILQVPNQIRSHETSPGVCFNAMLPSTGAFPTTTTPSLVISPASSSTSSLSSSPSSSPSFTSASTSVPSPGPTGPIHDICDICFATVETNFTCRCGAKYVNGDLDQLLAYKSGVIKLAPGGFSKFCDYPAIGGPPNFMLYAFCTDNHKVSTPLGSHIRVVYDGEFKFEAYDLSK